MAKKKRRKRPDREQSSSVTRAVRNGEVLLKDLLGLTRAELDALAREAERCVVRGDFERAVRLLGLLVDVDPYEPENWRQLALLLQQQAHHEAAVLCFETAALLAPRQADDTAAERRSLDLMGRLDLAHLVQEVSCHR
jgi:tetratricopeptide (TPR) repeat protein